MKKYVLGKKIQRKFFQNLTVGQKRRRLTIRTKGLLSRRVLAPFQWSLVSLASGNERERVPLV